MKANMKANLFDSHRSPTDLRLRGGRGRRGAAQAEQAAPEPARAAQREREPLERA
jgi:hypothetical protein